MSKHEYSVGQRVLIVHARRSLPEGAGREPVEAEVVKIGRAWGEALQDGRTLTVRFRLEGGAVDSKGYSTTEWVLTPEQHALREARYARDRRIHEAGVRFDFGRTIARSEAFLDALDVLVAEHLGKEADR